MRDEIVEVAKDEKTLPTTHQGWGAESPEYTGAAKAVAKDRIPQVGAVEPDVFVAKHRKSRTVGVADRNDLFDPFVEEIAAKIAFQGFPNAQKSAVRKPSRLPHASVGASGKVEVVFPIGRTV